MRALIQMNGRVPIVCVYQRCRRAFWGRQGSGKALWKIKDILSNILRATKYSVLGEKQGWKRKKEKPSLHQHLLPEYNLQPLRDSLFISDASSMLSERCLTEPAGKENNGGQGNLRVPQKQAQSQGKKEKNMLLESIPERKFQK